MLYVSLNFNRSFSLTLVIHSIVSCQLCNSQDLRVEIQWLADVLFSSGYAGLERRIVMTYRRFFADIFAILFARAIHVL